MLDQIVPLIEQLGPDLGVGYAPNLKMNLPSMMGWIVEEEQFQSAPRAHHLQCRQQQFLQSSLDFVFGCKCDHGYGTGPGQIWASLTI